MKVVSSILLLVLLFLKVPVETQTTKKIASAKITFEFVSKNVKGTIEGFESESRIDWENPENSYFKGFVQSETLDTHNGLRNWSLRGGKYFDTDDYPKITFESREVIKENDAFKVKGTLNIKGNKKDITIIFTKKGQQLVGTTSLYCIDYGIKIKKKREDNLVNIQMVFDISS